MLEITKDNFIAEVEGHDGLVVIDLWAEWCAPCRMLATILDELETEYKDVKFCKINIDNEPELAKDFKVQSIPTIAFVMDNTYIDLSVGLVPKSTLEKLILEYR